MKAALALCLGLATAFAIGSRAPRLAAGVAADTGRGAWLDPRAQIFVQRGCTECHAISGLGAVAAKDVGPDLTFAYADVVNRYGVNLESFLQDPSGVMRLMLASHLHLSMADRDSMLHVLKGLYEERRADMDEVIPSLPPLGPRVHVKR
jgi:mono/diheme cytochrome c family protein